MFSWYEDGAKSSQARFKDGEPHGRWREGPTASVLVARFKHGEEIHMLGDAAGKQAVCPRDESEGTDEGAQ